MTQEYQLIQGFQAQVTKQEPALLTTLVGNKGGGKNTFMAAVADEVLHMNPKEYMLSNTKITGTIYVPDILKWLAMKLMRQDETWCEVFIDEAAIAGLESRGSYKEARALDSYLFTLSRKVNANIWLSSQLLSMIEKRSQWISDFYVLCESQYEEKDEPEDMPFKSLRLPSYFEYTVYDNTLTECNTLEIDGRDAWDLFRTFRTQEIPFQERLERDFIAYYGISETDLQVYDEVMKIEKPIDYEEPVKKNRIEINIGRLSLPIDSKFMYAPDPNKLAEEKKYIIRDKYYRHTTNSYWAVMEEIA